MDIEAESEDCNRLLFCEVNSAASEQPVEDWITAKVNKLLKESSRDESGLIRGIYSCPFCGPVVHEPPDYKVSPSCHRVLKGGEMLMDCYALHKVKWHRADVPKSEIHKLVRLMGVEPDDLIAHFDTLHRNTERADEFEGSCKSAWSEAEDWEEICLKLAKAVYSKDEKAIEDVLEEPKLLRCDNEWKDRRK